MPVFGGQASVASVVWLAYVTAGISPCAPSAYVPSFIIRRRFGTFAPCSSACVTYSGFIPSTDTMTNTGTNTGAFSWALRDPPSNKTTAKTVRNRGEAEVLERTLGGLVIA